MPPVLCPECQRPLLPFNESYYYCAHCEVKTEELEKKVEQPRITPKDLEFLKRVKVKWD
jgi:uncharacterized Zn finger protein (UPF0148 family)